MTDRIYVGLPGLATDVLTLYAWLISDSANTLEAQLTQECLDVIGKNDFDIESICILSRRDVTSSQKLLHTSSAQHCMKEGMLVCFSGLC